MSEIKSFKGTTSTGFEFDISQKRMENYEVLEVLAEIDSNPLLVPKLLKLLLGEQVEDLKNHVRHEDGMVSTDKLMKEITDIFESPSVKK